MIEGCKVVFTINGVELCKDSIINIPLEFTWTLRNYGYYFKHKFSLN